MLEMGAAFRLLMAGKLEAVLPLDDAAALEAANPFKADGCYKPDKIANDLRENAMVNKALAAGPVTIIICGGSQDLGPAIARMGKPGCEYIRVTVRAHEGVVIPK